MVTQQDIRDSQLRGTRKHPLPIAAATIVLTAAVATIASRHVRGRLLFSRVALVVIGLEFAALALWQRHRVLETLKTFFTAPDHPLNLAIFRMALFGAIFNDVNISSTLSFSRMPAGLEFAPWGMAHVLLYLPINPAWAKTACVLLLIFCVTGFVGFLSRTSALACAILGFYVFGISNFFGKVDHNHHLLWFAVLLAASPCGDALAVDVLLAERKRPLKGAFAAQPDRAYALPLRFAALLMGVIYFFPGFWKLWQSGLDWFLTDDLRNQLYLFWTWSYHAAWLPLFRIDQHPLLCKAAAIATVLFELSFIFLVFSPKLRPVAAFAGFIFHSSTNLLMQISFLSLRICYVALIDWAALLRCMRTPLRPWRTPLEALPPLTPAGARSAPIVAVGILLLVGSICAGITRHVHGWPFACYPTFSSSTPERIPSLTLFFERPSGAEIPVADLGFPYHRFYGLSRDLLAIQDRVERDDRLRLLWSRAVQVYPELSAQGEARFYLEDLWINPGRWERNPANRRLLFAFDPSEHPVPTRGSALYPDVEWQ
jgi:hypothetical protein